ncbi:fibronectin type III domain-containing protein, partial [Candidatus Woesearchaeota archaeon]|nr:fibronectin type III domain-containing protein [Candidatus Woesearchaeota archaeon]
DTYSIVVSNVNDPPATITLNYPNDNDTAFTNRTPEYNWSRSADPDNVTLLYHLEVSTDRDFASGMVINDSGINNMTRYKQNATLGFTTYWWRARASDNASWSGWSATYNFTVVSSIDISLTTSVVNFGFLPVGTRNDTSDNDPSPFVLENAGNTELNISVNASAELWLSSLAPLNSSYFQTKANLSEIGSINTAKSQMTYINLSSEFKYIAAWFNWTARNDTITIDINITAPSDESAGTRSTNITIRAEAAG